MSAKRAIKIAASSAAKKEDNTMAFKTPETAKDNSAPDTRSAPAPQQPVPTNPDAKKTALPAGTNKATKLAALIKQGGQTKESLMNGIDVNPAGLASQLSYLNTRGLNIAEVAPDKAEFPMKGEDGIYYMGKLAEYQAKHAGGSGGFAKKERTVKEMLEFAQKREDQASAAAAKAKEKADANKSDEILKLKVQAADLNLKIAGALLARVEAGDYSYETCIVKE